MLSLAIAATAALTACSGGGSSSSASTCTRHGTNLTITAANIAFDKSCLAVVANHRFTLVFHNEDANTVHTFSLYTNSTLKHPIFRSPDVTGIKTETYQLTALPPGTYYFQCDVHPQMHGVFLVQAPGARPSTSAS